MDVRTIPELLRYARETHRKRDAFLVRRHGRWTPLSIEWFAAQVDACAASLQAMRVARGDRVAILSENRIDWAIADCALLSLGAVTVPIYPSLVASQIGPLLADAGAIGAFASSRAQVEKLERVKPDVPTLRWIRCFDTEPLAGEAPEADRRAPAGGAPAPNPEGGEPGPGDLATIIYTSGTSGASKGVMLTHENIVSNVKNALQALALRPTDVHLSFLPLSHVFERTCGQFVMMYAGATIAYAESLEKAAVNLQEVKPTVLLSVPRFYEKVIERAMQVAAAAGFPRKQLAFWGRRVAMRWADLRTRDRPVPATLRLQHALAGRLVYPVLRRRLGGRLRLLISGGAALPRDAGLFFYGIGSPVHEGYGLTETSPVIAFNTADRYRFGTVGPVIPGVEVRIADDGEILARGPSVMKGYWNRVEETANALEGGWFHTGDIGEISADGFLRITDRKKDLLVTSGGKKIAPQPIEIALRQSPSVAEAIVVGDGRQYATALIAPAEGATRESIEAHVKSVNATLAPFETIKRFELIPNDLTIENGHLTPTLKVKRRAVAERYRDLIESMYHTA